MSVLIGKPYVFVPFKVSFLAKTQLRRRKGRGNGDISQNEGFQFELRKNFQMVKAVNHCIEMPEEKEKERKRELLQLGNSGVHKSLGNSDDLDPLCP